MSRGGEIAKMEASSRLKSMSLCGVDVVDEVLMELRRSKMFGGEVTYGEETGGGV